MNTSPKNIQVIPEVVQNNVEIPPVDKALNDHQRLFYWEMYKAGVPVEERTEVLAEIYLYVTQRYHRYNPERAGLATFLDWQCKGAIRQQYRRDHLHYSDHVEKKAVINNDGEKSNILDFTVDNEALDGRTIEEQYSRREKFNKVIDIARNRGMSVNFSIRLSSQLKSALRAIWLEVDAEEEDDLGLI